MGRRLGLERSRAGRSIKLEMPAAVNAIYYVLRTGCQWDDLPKGYPNHNSVYYDYAKWRRNGTWRRMNDALR